MQITKHQHIENDLVVWEYWIITDKTGSITWELRLEKDQLKELYHLLQVELNK